MSRDAHPELPEFDYLRPTSLAEASQFLASHAGEARPLMGGTDIFVRMRDGFWQDKFLVDVKYLDGVNEIKFEPLVGLTIGAAVNMNRVIAAPEVQAHYPLLAEACRWVASHQLRSRATLAGNICNASPAGDTIGACLVMEGRLKVHGVDGFRTEPLESFFLGPGKTRLKPGDIVTAIRFPLPPAVCAGTYIKLGRNRLSDLAIVGVTALVYRDAVAPSGYSFRIALASVAPTPLLLNDVQAFLESSQIGPAAFQEAARMAEAACSPIDDVRGSAAYRRMMVNRLTFRALIRVWEAIEK